MKSKSFLLVVISFMMFTSTFVEATVEYNVIGLGSLPGGRLGAANAINNNGLIRGGGWPASGNYTAILIKDSE